MLTHHYCRLAKHSNHINYLYYIGEDAPQNIEFCFVSLTEHIGDGICCNDHAIVVLDAASHG